MPTVTSSAEHSILLGLKQGQEHINSGLGADPLQQVSHLQRPRQLRPRLLADEVKQNNACKPGVVDMKHGSVAGASQQALALSAAKSPALTHLTSCSLSIDEAFEISVGYTRPCPTPGVHLITKRAAGCQTAARSQTQHLPAEE